ncbi:MAG: acyl transferase [Bacteroidetes bacterium]|nr:acyl transferase [Bacteroidota bacterium]
MRDQLRSRIFSIDDADFEALAMDVFRYQFDLNPVYRDFCRLLNKSPEKINNLTDLPFLPVEIFKSKRITTGNTEADFIFTSSGTTHSTPAKHYVPDVSLYEQSFIACFQMFFGDPADWAILALLPSYLEREGSSLIYMTDHLIRKSRHAESGFFLYDHKELCDRLMRLEEKKVKTILLGVSYALLDFAEKNQLSLQSTVVMETGGMKGRRAELTRDELHHIIMSRLRVLHVASEYGMTELLSQAYSLSDGMFNSPPWMRVLAREINDPLNVGTETGAANIIDLANLDSCCFIATADLVKIHSIRQFEVLGRMDNEDIRGCNLLVE